MNLPALIDRCSEITKSHGFDVTQHRTQLCLMATEIAEALANVSQSRDNRTNLFSAIICGRSAEYESFRAYNDGFNDFVDRSKVIDKEHLLEELSDTLIRICSYVGGNGWRDEFIKALTEKIEKNANRPYRHGKGF